VKYTTLPLITLLCISIQTRAQIGSTMLQYSGNQMVYNPSYAGLYDFMEINLSARKHWTGLPGSPSLISLNGHAPLKRQQHAVGFVVQREQWSEFTENSAYANYAHKLYFDESFLSFGLQAGFLNHVTDWSMIEFVPNWNDPVMREGRVSNTTFDVNVGAYFQAGVSYVGLSARHLTNPVFDISKDTAEWREQIHSQYFLVVGHYFDLNDDWGLQTELVVRHISTIPLMANLALLAKYRTGHYVGIQWLPVQQSVSFTAKIPLTRQFEIDYTYDAYYSRIRPYQRGSHEISLTFFVTDLWKR
jgi:type IX secretion system PorP/SprF family membrane protein